MNPLELDPQNPRRDFLKKLSAAGLAALMAPEPRLLGADAEGAPVVAPKPRADACILLWMGGGMAAPSLCPSNWMPRPTCGTFTASRSIMKTKPG